MCTNDQNGLSRGSVVNMTESVQNQVYIAHFFSENKHTHRIQKQSAEIRISSDLGSAGTAFSQSTRSERGRTNRTGSVADTKIMLTQILQVSLD